MLWPILSWLLLVLHDGLGQGPCPQIVSLSHPGARGAGDLCAAAGSTRVASLIPLKCQAARARWAPHLLCIFWAEPLGQLAEHWPGDPARSCVLSPHLLPSQWAGTTRGKCQASSTNFNSLA